MKILLIKFFFILLSSSLIAQIDWVKWDKSKADYRIKDNSGSRNYSFQSDNPGELVLKSFTNAYWFFISDVDGDNCPFRPSCSSFFVDAVKETNFFQGSLMFFDRFTRDLNIFKKGNYPRVISGHYYDPAAQYSLSKEKIVFIPSNETVTSE